MDAKPLKSRWGIYVALGLIIAAGAYFRIARLEVASLRADTIHFWNICRSDITAWGIVTEWTKLLLQLESHLPADQRPAWLLPS